MLRDTVATAAPSSGWLRYIEWWYLMFALLAGASTGVMAILVPIEVMNLDGHPGTVGVVMAGTGLGMLTAPLWGELADRRRWHRGLCVGGALAIALAMVFLAYVRTEELWILSTFLAGVGVAAAFTAGNLVIVESHPPDEWDRRIGWLQTVSTVGTVIGLALAGALDHQPLEVGFLAGAAMAVLGAVIGGLSLRSPAPPRSAVAGASWRDKLSHLNTHHLLHAPTRASFSRLAHHLTLGLNRSFGTFVGAWLLSLLGLSAIGSLYPLIMQDVFGIASEPASFILAAATALSLGLFAVSGLLITRLTPLRVLQAGLAGRLACLIALIFLGLAAVGGRDWLAGLAYALLMLVWPLMSVASAVLAPLLLPRSAGEGMGMYNAAGAVAGIAGPILGGWLAFVADYEAVLLFGLVGVALALFMSVPIRPPAGLHPAAVTS